MRAIAAIVAGIIAGLAIVILIGVIGMGATYPLPAGLDPYDTDQVVALIEAMPAAPKFALFAALLAGTLSGAAIAKLIAGKAWPAWVVTALLALYVILSILSLPLSGIEQMLAIVAPIAGGLIGNHLVSDRQLADEQDAVASDI